MEVYISNELELKCIIYKREVTFRNCFNPKTGKLLRFDFYIPSLNVLIEYDGKGFHDNISVLNRDYLKTQFAKDYNIKLFRITGKIEVLNCINNIIKLKNKKPKKKRIKVKKISILDRQKERLQSSRTKPMQWVFKDDKANHAY